VGLYFEPVFSGLPWSFIQGKPTYNNKRIVLECIPCEYHCRGCLEGQLYVNETKRCIYSDICPSGFIRESIGSNNCIRDAGL